MKVKKKGGQADSSICMSRRDTKKKKGGHKLYR